MVHTGPMGMPRPAVQCEKSVVFELTSSLREDEKQQLEDTLSAAVDFPVSVEEGLSIKESGSTDVKFDTGSFSVDSGVINDLRSEIFNAGFDFDEWRVQ